MTKSPISQWIQSCLADLEDLGIVGQKDEVNPIHISIVLTRFAAPANAVMIDETDEAVAVKVIEEQIFEISKSQFEWQRHWMKMEMEMVAKSVG